MGKTLLLVATLAGLCLTFAYGGPPPPPHPLLSETNPELIKECAESSGFSPEEAKKMKDFKEGDKPPEALLCFIKCLSEKEGYLDESGKYIEAKFDELKVPPYVTEDQVKEVKDCLLNSPAVSTCSDMETVFECFKPYRPAQ